MSVVTHFASSVAYDALAAYMLLVLLLLLLLLLMLLLDGEIASHKGTQLFPTSNISLLSKYQVQNLPNQSQYHSGAELFFHMNYSTKK